ncbi:MAG TPA: citryl-CoA lyase [Amycolatopsis sp.]|jgi:citrate synthase|nr:citryl-CoA lyase [Amycolatopsis sp.]
MAAKAQPSTAIAHPTADRVIVRGFDLAQELIGSATTTDYFYVLITGSKPTAVQTNILDACIVALAEHGLVPSVQAARMTYAASPEALHGAVAAGLLGAGSVILGSSEDSAHLLASIVEDAAANDRPIDATAKDAVRKLRAAHQPVPGVGHPLHREEDPRATALLAYAKAHGVSGPHTRALAAVVDAVPEIYGRRLPLNVSGAIPAVLLDADFPARAIKGIPLIGRTMSLVAHLLEEQETPIGFALADAAEKAVDYTGPIPS